ncbi:AmpG family muropeptide MFS transporter [Pseudidiomarina donghaiensis]|jgi:PAT family beta-lactamase induction signal transducer AmpG|uniref:MFS transporter n=1 Tax=Pseudidiomarina donghaiensis TaxID=519452 RepID=A0A432XLM4_9GAMM|nr:MFS transporter [Pseudidiomarina donghaiensis]RUO49587.1 MFS transporter [Pseudidiomarina donghaiensis]SFV21561.1 MFS transporter, PAT family, beta-lactamase induction signal transducer AmpG [Pseudidiomarina donghaiensis]
MTSSQPWYKDFSIYREPRIWVIFGFGVISGFPWVLIGSMLSAWLQEVGVDRSAIGLFGVVFVAYSVNALWSPLVDRVKVPKLQRWFGQRRAWMLLCLFGILAATLTLTQLDVVTDIWWVALMALVIAIFSATQDVAIDAYRIETFGPHEARLQSAGAAMATAGWWSGYSGLGAIPFFLVDGTSLFWQDAYTVLCFVIGAQILFVMATRESTRYRPAIPQFNRWQDWLLSTLVEPITEYFKRSGWQLALGMLAFIFLFKIGEAFLGRMSIVFYKEIGFSNDDIAVYSKMVTWWVTIVFAILGSFVNLKLGIVRGLLTGGIAMSASNLMFAWIAGVGPNTNLLLAAVIIDGFTAAWSTVAFVAFISLLCNRAFTATQYALFASLGNLGRTLLSSYSGYVVNWLNGDWQLFFILTAIMVTPSLLILLALRKPLTRLEQNYQRELN